jgi:GNAT superfamily N-acetyltransferase
MFHGRTGIHDDIQAGCVGTLRCGCVDHAQLKPDGLDAQSILLSDGLVDDRTDPLAVDEAVHDLDRVRDISEPAIAALAKGVLTAKIDGHNVHAEPVAQVPADAVRGAFGVGGQADNGPGRRRRQQPLDYFGVQPRRHSTDPGRYGQRPPTGGWLKSTKAGAIIADMIIRPIRSDDRRAWAPLWQGYLEFYRAALTPEVTDGTWAALCDPSSPVHGLVAEEDDHLVGLAHLIVHPTTWARRPTCYLEDLYVAKPWRGQDIARRLIEAVYAFADESGVGSVYWLTQEYNAPARSLYDTLAHRTSFVVYQR